jgi:hypothetical protein
MGCICEIFENETVWLILLTLLVLTLVCGNGAGYGSCGCGSAVNSCGCR